MEEFAYEDCYDEEICENGYDVIMYTLQCIEEFDD